MSQIQYIGANIIYNNNQITIAKDIIFGMNVLSDCGFIPLDSLDKAEFDECMRLIDSDPIFPFKAEMEVIWRSHHWTN